MNYLVKREGLEDAGPFDKKTAERVVADFQEANPGKQASMELHGPDGSWASRQPQADVYPENKPVDEAAAIAEHNTRVGRPIT